MSQVILLQIKFESFVANLGTKTGKTKDFSKQN